MVKHLPWRAIRRDRTVIVSCWQIGLVVRIIFTISVAAGRAQLTRQERLIHVPHVWFDPFWLMTPMVRRRADIRSPEKLLHKLKPTHWFVANIMSANKLPIQLNEGSQQLCHDARKTIRRVADWVLYRMLPAIGCDDRAVVALHRPRSWLSTLLRNSFKAYDTRWWGWRTDDRINELAGSSCEFVANECGYHGKSSVLQLSRLLISEQPSHNYVGPPSSQQRDCVTAARARDVGGRVRARASLVPY